MKELENIEVTNQPDNDGRFERYVMCKPKSVVYLNLTNGLEALPLFANNYRVCRIQSTACEQKRWDFILADLDNNLLFDLAVGKTCFIVDYTQRKKAPRALFQGVEWIKYVLTKLWLNQDYKANIRGNDASVYFAQMMQTLKPSTLKKLKYYKKFINCDKIDLISVSDKTVNDGKYGYYVKLTEVYT